MGLAQSSRSATDHRRSASVGVAIETAELFRVSDKIVVGIRSQWPSRGVEPVFYRVLTLRDGKIIHMQDCPDRSSAMQAAGLTV